MGLTWLVFDQVESIHRFTYLIKCEKERFLRRQPRCSLYYPLVLMLMPYPHMTWKDSSTMCHRAFPTRVCKTRLPGQRFHCRFVSTLLYTGQLLPILILIDCTYLHFHSAHGVYPLSRSLNVLWYDWRQLDKCIFMSSKWCPQMKTFTSEHRKIVVILNFPVYADRLYWYSWNTCAVACQKNKIERELIWKQFVSLGLPDAPKIKREVLCRTDLWVCWPHWFGCVE